MLTQCKHSAHMHTCIVHTHTCIQAGKHAHTQRCIQTGKHAHTYTHTHASLHTLSYMHTGHSYIMINFAMYCDWWKTRNNFIAVVSNDKDIDRQTDKCLYRGWMDWHYLAPKPLIWSPILESAPKGRFKNYFWTYFLSREGLIGSSKI